MRVLAVLSMFSVCLCTGCALESASTSTSLHAGESLGLQGNIHGGQQPVSGSHIYLFAAGTTASAGKGITASTANASVSLITDSTLSDSKGNYVLSDAGGNFSLGGKYACTAGQNVYALAYNGNPGVSQNNPYIEMMAILGTCPASGNFASTIGFFTINEETTVAAAFALAGFATDPLHISGDEAASGNTSAAVAKIGMQNAFANSFNLVQQVSGLPYNYDNLPPSGGNVYSYAINTVANILAYCINSNGSTCNSLFLNTKNSAGVVPSDTATAAINIAQNPYNNVATLIALTSATSPFQPTFNVGDTNDFQLAIKYPLPTNTYQHNNLAVDSTGNVYITSNGGGYQGYGAVTKLGPQGQILSPQYGLTGTKQVNHPWGIAIDPNNDNVWFSAAYDSKIYAYTSGGSLYSPSAGWTATTDGSGNSGLYMAFDSNGNAWTAADNFRAAFSGTGTLLTGASGLFKNSGAHGLSPDASGNMWVGIYNAGASVNVEKLPSSYSATLYTGLSGAAVFGICVDGNGGTWTPDYGGGLTHFSSTGTPSTRIIASTDAGWGCAVDGNNTIWHIARNNGLHQFKVDGTRITPAPVSGNNGGITGFYILSNPIDIAIDASGSMWILNDDDLSVTQVFGAAAPVVTPLARAAKLNKIGQRP